MNILVLLGKIFLGIFAFANVALALYLNRNKFAFAISIWKRIRIGMCIQTFAVVVLTITFAVTCIILFPATNWGWANLFFQDGGNVLIKPVLETSDSPHLLIRLIAPLFLLVFLAVMPFVTHTEEILFRKGYHSWKKIMWQSIKFGFVHMTVGVPLAAAIMLCGVGAFFAYKYHKAYLGLSQILPEALAEEVAVLTSTTYHTVYNSIVIGILLIVTIAAL